MWRERHHQAARALTADGIINFAYSLKSDYARRATLLLNRKTVGAIRLLKSSTSGEYIWQTNYQAGSPPTILGLPYLEMPDMPDVAGSAFPIALGDFNRGYMIVDRVDMSVTWLNELYATSGQVGFLIRKRVGGQVILPEAILKLEVATS